MEKIKNIIYNTSWEKTDFKSNNEIYKNEAFDDFFIFDNNDIQEISRYYLYCQLKYSLLNKYEFFPENFEKYNYINCKNTIDENEIKYLVSFIINGTIYGFFTKEKAQQISDLFDINQNISLFKSILENVEVNKKNLEDYYEWTTYINELDKNESTNISLVIYNKSITNSNIGISYISLKNKLVNALILETLLNKIKIYNTSLIDFKIFIYKDIFFELLFYSQDINIIIPNEDLMVEEWKKSLANLYIYNSPVDNIGNRYYYVKNNFVLSLIKKQTSLEQRAKDEIISYHSEGTILDPSKIYDEYQKEYGKKTTGKELEYIINYYMKINGNARFDVFTLGG